jgi:hypothetical protein
MKTYRSQFVADLLSLGAEPGAVRHAWQRDCRHRKALERKAHELANCIGNARPIGLVPLDLDDEGRAQVISILDCPRNWTSDRVAAFREEGFAILAAMKRDYRLEALILAYLAGAPEYEQRSRFDRYRTHFGVKVK